MRPWSRRRGRHCRRGSWTGWSALAHAYTPVVPVEDDSDNPVLHVIRINPYLRSTWS